MIKKLILFVKKTIEDVNTELANADAKRIEKKREQLAKLKTKNASKKIEYDLDKELEAERAKAKKMQGNNKRGTF